MKTSLTLLACLILIFCIWNARSFIGLLDQNSFYEKFSWILLFIWCLPILYYWIASRKLEKTLLFNPLLLTLALFFSVLGILGDLHVFHYIGLAFVLAAFIPWSAINIIWIFASFFWMPGLSWIASHIALNYIEFIFLFRLLILSIISFGMIYKFYLPSY